MIMKDPTVIQGKIRLKLTVMGGVLAVKRSWRLQSDMGRDLHSRANLPGVLFERKN